ncbi:MAG TPA: NlpC/P60 family protein [Trebonia sp.]
MAPPDARGIRWTTDMEDDGTMDSERTGRTKSLRIGVAVVAGAVTVAAIGYVGQALAATQPTITQVKQQINAMQAKADMIGQQYDQVTEELAQARAKLGGARRDATQAQAQFTQTRAKLAQLVAGSYEDGTQSSADAVISSSDPATVLSQASLLQEIADNRKMQIAVYLDDARQLTAAREKRARTEQGIASLQAQLAAKQKSLDTLIASQQAVLSKLTAQQRAEVAAQSIGGAAPSTASHPTAAKTPAPTSSPTPTPSATASPSASASASTTSAGEEAVAFAKAQIGKPYEWGATGPNAYDCSGLVQAAWASAGVSIPRDTYEQWAALPHIAETSLEPGDLVFFESLGHVGIYIGGGMMIDAPTTGQVVTEHPLNSYWYAQNYVGAARP